ncbi:hypothetical protein IM792_21090 [Mucilaginibacter sp. JRF]|uniref:hypothetical protein n=1 Tax=Mucilaginibacter sp. JRF TaxID=2780088 RepID=UPI00188114B2|nr:hypothetical protein [Mucilaginibacter sp. JRF]MBE9586957.1 hypothetical protein [Mucilaginibacter sp. JRF]
MMKNKFIFLAMLAIPVVLTNCKKDLSSPSESTPTSERSLTTAAVSSIKVETLYGSPYATGALVNGKGTSARFNSPRGLQLIPDGTIYVADMKNDVIRKIATTGEVSTVATKPADYGGVMTDPIYIGVEYETGILHIVQDGNTDFDPFDQTWIFKPNGDFVATNYYYYTSSTGMARNPYTDKFYFSSGNLIREHFAQPTGEIYGPGYDIDDSKLQNPENEGSRGFSWDALAIGYNKVLYVTTNGRIYKVTPGGVTEQIFKNINFDKITSMIFNKDSRTMYVADNGYIKRVDGTKLTILAGPTGANNGHDGPASTADVYAFGLALDKGENAIYFTDQKANTIRKISLK